MKLRRRASTKYQNRNNIRDCGVTNFPVNNLFVKKNFKTFVVCLGHLGYSQFVHCILLLPKHPVQNHKLSTKTDITFWRNRC